MRCFLCWCLMERGGVFSVVVGCCACVNGVVRRVSARVVVDRIEIILRVRVMADSGVVIRMGFVEIYIFFIMYTSIGDFGVVRVGKLV